LDENIVAEIEQLRRLGAGELRDRYRELFGEECRSFHRQFLFRKLAWRLQARAEGELSERARRRALEIADEAQLRVTAPKEFFPPPSAAAGAGGARARRGLPRPGTVLSRRHKDRNIVVRVLEEGFEYDGRRFGSLSAIATEVTGTRWNGLVFFGVKAGARK
jgi:hypothetical protein